MENKDIITNNEPNNTGSAVKPDYSAEISAIIKSNDTPKTIIAKLDDYHANDIAEVMEEFSVNERKKFYRVCSLDMLAEIFEYFDEDDAGVYINEMDIRKAAAVISRLDTDTAVDILREIDKEKRALIIEAVDPDIRNEIKQLLKLKLTDCCVLEKS